MPEHAKDKLLEVWFQDKVDLSRFDAAPLIAFTVTKETDYGTETDGGIPPRCSADFFFHL